MQMRWERYTHSWDATCRLDISWISMKALSTVKGPLTCMEFSGNGIVSFMNMSRQFHSHNCRSVVWKRDTDFLSLTHNDYHWLHISHSGLFTIHCDVRFWGYVSCSLSNKPCKCSSVYICISLIIYLTYGGRIQGHVEVCVDDVIVGWLPLSSSVSSSSRGTSKSSLEILTLVYLCDVFIVICLY